MVTQYACNKPASWPFKVKPSVAKKDLLSQSLEWYMHCVVLVTFAREPRKQKKTSVQANSQGHVSHYQELRSRV